MSCTTVPESGQSTKDKNASISQASKPEFVSPEAPSAKKSSEHTERRPSDTEDLADTEVHIESFTANKENVGKRKR